MDQDKCLSIRNLTRETVRKSLDMLTFTLVVLFSLLFVNKLTDFKPTKFFLRISPNYELIEYRGVEIFIPHKEFPKEQRYIFDEVIDSLYDDVVEEYSLEKISTSIIVLDKLYRNAEWAAGFVYNESNQIFLTSLFYSSEGNDGDRAMAIVHEYVHVIQHRYPEYLEEYAEFVGWEGKFEEVNLTLSKPMTFEEYSLRSPAEDMAVNFELPYLCGNSIDMLSQERLEMISTFWKGPRESYCKDFP